MLSGTRALEPLAGFAAYLGACLQMGSKMLKGCRWAAALHSAAECGVFLSRPPVQATRFGRCCWRAGASVMTGAACGCRRGARRWAARETTWRIAGAARAYAASNCSSKSPAMQDALGEGSIADCAGTNSSIRYDVLEESTL